MRALEGMRRGQYSVRRHKKRGPVAPALIASQVQVAIDLPGYSMSLCFIA
jgi:hypothetical protein